MLTDSLREIPKIIIAINKSTLNSRNLFDVYIHGDVLLIFVSYIKVTLFFFII